VKEMIEKQKDTSLFLIIYKSLEQFPFVIEIYAYHICC